MLNNHGWGMKDMIIYSCIILLFLLIATYYIRYSYKGLSNASNTVVDKNNNQGEKTKTVDYNIYRNYEQRMNNAAINYVYKHYGSLDRSIASIYLSDLSSNGYIEPLYDQLDNTMCVGYSNVWDTEDSVLHASSYIKCNSYKTDGYIG